MVLLRRSTIRAEARYGSDTDSFNRWSFNICLPGKQLSGSAPPGRGDAPGAVSQVLPDDF